MGEKRDESFPEIPTAKEQGINWVSVGWRGFATQKEVPTEIVTKLQDTLTLISHSEDYKRFMREQGFTIEVKVGSDFDSFLKLQDEQWKSVLDYYVAE